MKNNKHLDELLETLISYAREENELTMSYPANEEYHKGRREGFELAAKWLNIALIEIKFDNLYK